MAELLESSQTMERTQEKRERGREFQSNNLVLHSPLTTHSRSIFVHVLPKLRRLLLYDMCFLNVVPNDIIMDLNGKNATVISWLVQGLGLL